MMGSSEDELERGSNETQLTVHISQGYWLADTTCTQEVWQAVMGKNPSRFKGKQRPVEGVSWDDIQEFLKRLSKGLSDSSFRLPSEAEWEYACRAGTTTTFSCGESIHSDQANFDGNYPMPNTSKSRYRAITVDVASLPANAWGLYEMHGNVLEWCADAYVENYASHPHHTITQNQKRIAVDPYIHEHPKSDSRVLRGGSWYGSGWVCRSAGRLDGHPAGRFHIRGFRLASSLK